MKESVVSAPLSPGQCTGTSELPEDSNWAFASSPRDCRMSRQIGARRWVQKGGGCHKGRGQQRRGWVCILLDLHAFQLEGEGICKLGGQLGSLAMPLLSPRV